MENKKIIPIQERIPQPIFTHAYARHDLYIIDENAPAIKDSVDLREHGVQSYIGSYLLAVDKHAGGYGTSKDTINGVNYHAKKFCVTPEQVVEDIRTRKCVRVCSYINVHINL